MSDRLTITVTPEGREGLWLADRESLKAWIEEQNFEHIHNFIASGALVVGADHEVPGVLADIDAAERVAVLTGEARMGNLGHALALIMPAGQGRPERLEMFDIGDVTEADLTIEVVK